MRFFRQNNLLIFTFALLAFAILTTAYESNAQRNNYLFQRCPGAAPSILQAKVEIQRDGDINLIPCSGRTIQQNGTPISLGGATIGGAITGATTGSVLFSNSSAQFAQDNTRFFYDSTDGVLKLLDKNYVGTSGGWNNAVKYFQIANDTAISNNTVPVYGAMFDVKRTQTGGTGQQTSGLRTRAWDTRSGGSGAIFTGTESFVRNLGATAGDSYLQGVEGIAQLEDNGFLATGGWFQAQNSSGGSGSSVTGWLSGVRSTVSSYAGWTVANAIAYDGIIATGGATITNRYGTRYSGWSGTGVVNNYVIYADNSTNAGSGNNYFIYSLSTAPSLLTGSLTASALTTGGNVSGQNIVANDQIRFASASQCKGSGTLALGSQVIVSNCATPTSVIMVQYTGNAAGTTVLTVGNKNAGDFQVWGDNGATFDYLIINVN